MTKLFSRKFTSLKLVLFLKIAILSAGAHAAQCPLIPDGKANMDGFQRAQLLSNGKYEQLESELRKVHQKNLGSDGGDLLTLRALVEMLQISGQDVNVVRMWVDQRPDSFFSQLTAGLFYTNQASFARGDKAASEVSRNQSANMKKLGQVAVEHLQKAIKLEPRSALPHGAMLTVASLQGNAGGQTAQQWLNSAIQSDPKSLSARISAVTYLSPRWGGSFDMLDQMASQSTKSLSAQGAHYLQYNIVLEKASHQEVIEKNKAQAHALYKQAQSLCENSATARDGAIKTYP